MSRAVICFLGVLFLVLFSLSQTGCKTVSVAGECPESADLRCLSAKICQTDEKRGCQKCSCEGVWETDPYKAAEQVEGGEEQ